MALAVFGFKSCGRLNRAGGPRMGRYGVLLSFFGLVSRTVRRNSSCMRRTPCRKITMMVRGVVCREQFRRSLRWLLWATNSTIHHLPDCHWAEWRRVLLVRLVPVGRKRFNICQACGEALLLWEVWPLPLPIGLLPKAGAGQERSHSAGPDQRHVRHGQGIVALPGCPGLCRCSRRLVCRQVAVCPGLAHRPRHASIAARASANLMGRSAPPLRLIFLVALV